MALGRLVAYVATRVKMARHQYTCGEDQFFQMAGVHFESKPDAFEISGADKSGKPWVLIVMSDNCTFWQADLDGDGSPDFVFVHQKGLYTVQLLAVLFDAERRPVPWVITGDFGIDEDGIAEFFDLNRDGSLNWSLLPGSPVQNRNAG